MFQSSSSFRDRHTALMRSAALGDDFS
jgi:hypothetical protein